MSLPPAVRLTHGGSVSAPAGRARQRATDGKVKGEMIGFGADVKVGGVLDGAGCGGAGVEGVQERGEVKGEAGRVPESAAC